MTIDRRERDIVIIGGGPAGATAATLLADYGHDVLLLEREDFPRFKVGESLMPGTYWTLQRLGILEQMKMSAFPKKYSVQFYSKSGRAAAPFYFHETESGEYSQTWQVRRSEFDQMMLENARDKGAEVQHGVSVTDILFEGERAVGVTARLADKSTTELRAKVVVDASGQSALLSRKLQISREEPCLRNAAIFSHFKHVKRDSGIDEGATIIFHTQNQESWFWFIPLPDDVVSVGVVGLLSYLLEKRDGTPQEIFEQELAICPALQPRLEGSDQLFPMKTTKEFSYKADRMAGDGFVLIGDAFGFLDPIYSSGVFLALKSGEMAADAIHEAFVQDDFSGASLSKFAEKFLPGMESMRKLVYAFYTPGFSFARFLKEHPECRGDIVDILVGNVYRKEVNGLFKHLADYADLPEDTVLTTD